MDNLNLKDLKGIFQEISEKRGEVILSSVPINIWDDYYDDGYVPDGEKQETYIFVEGTDLSHENQKICLEIFLSYVKETLNINDIKFMIRFYNSRKEFPELVGNPVAEDLFYERWQIEVEGLTHERLDEWIDFFGDGNININGVPFFVYSES